MPRIDIGDVVRRNRPTPYPENDKLLGNQPYIVRSMSIFGNELRLSSMDGFDVPSHFEESYFTLDVFLTEARKAVK